MGFSNNAELQIIVDEWIQGIDEQNSQRDISPEEILQSFRDLCCEFNIPEDLAHETIERLLG